VEGFRRLACLKFKKREPWRWCQHVVCDELALFIPGCPDPKAAVCSLLPLHHKSTVVRCTRLIRLVGISYATPVFETLEKIPVPRASEDCH